MQDWNKVFNSLADSGVYTVASNRSVEALSGIADARGLDVSTIDLHGVMDKAGFLGEIASALDFPSYFGMNWDALNECLADLSWKQAEGYVLLFTGFQGFAEAAAKDAAIVVQILGVAANLWRERKVPFYAILSA